MGQYGLIGEEKECITGELESTPAMYSKVEKKVFDESSLRVDKCSISLPILSNPPLNPKQPSQAFIVEDPNAFSFNSVGKEYVTKFGQSIAPTSSTKEEDKAENMSPLA